jgi:hypothetical protein
MAHGTFCCFPRTALSDRTRKGRVGSKAIEIESHPIVLIKVATVHEPVGPTVTSLFENPTLAQPLRVFYGTSRKLATNLYTSGQMNTVQTPPLTYSVALVRKRTIPTERTPLVGEVNANFCG